MWSKADAMLGQGQKRTINLLVFSNPMLKDALAHLMSGKGPSWEFSREAGEIYLAQVTSERREERVDAHGRVSHIWKQIRKDNHLFDCEVLQVLAALATNFIGAAG